MTLLDAYALVALLVGGPAAPHVRAVLRDGGVAVATANLARATHYHRSSRPISLADAVLIGSARKDDRIATADPDVLAVARADKLESVELPSQG